MPSERSLENQIQELEKNVYKYGDSSGAKGKKIMQLKEELKYSKTMKRKILMI